MKVKKTIFERFTKIEKMIWCTSIAVIAAGFLIFDRGGVLTPVASLIGVTSLLFNAGGNPFGQVLMVAFSLIYGVISYQSGYYGEMLTYLGMTMPMSVFALISWIKNPFEGDCAQVKIGRLKKFEPICMCILAMVVTGLFYFILAYFHTANIVISTVSVTTSFLAVYLTFRRSKYFALAYAANDIVLIVLWAMASVKERRYLSVVICFCAFFVNDLYTFANWGKMEKMQTADVNLAS